MEYSMIVLSQNTQLGLAEYELLRNSHAISQQSSGCTCMITKSHSRDSGRCGTSLLLYYNRSSLLLLYYSRLSLIMLFYSRLTATAVLQQTI